MKEAVFPFNRFPEVDPILGPEMRATGEVMGIADNFGLAYFKSQAAANSKLPLEGTALISVNRREREFLHPVVQGLHELGFKLLATEGTAKYLTECGIPNTVVNKLNEGRPNMSDLIKNHQIQLIINTPKDRNEKLDDSYIRMMAIQNKIAYMTTIAAAKATVAGIAAARHDAILPKSLQEYQAGK